MGRPRRGRRAVLREIVPAYASYLTDYVIDDTQLKQMDVAPPIQLVFPLSRYVERDSLGGGLQRPRLGIGLNDYWKIYDDPRDASE